MKANENLIEMFNYFESESKTKYAEIRAEKIAYYQTQIENDDGAFGRAFELWTARDKSRKTRVASQGKTDTYVKIIRNGKTVYERAECKVNGGRIESLYQKNAPKYVIYCIAVKNSTANTIIYPKIIKTVDFLDMLEDLGAIKSTNGVNAERAIQVSKRGLWKWLEEQTDFYPDDEYEEETV